MKYKKAMENNVNKASRIKRAQTRLFIADDSDLVRNRLKEIINEIKNIDLVGEARNANEAIKLLKTLKADIIVIDIRMPGGNGMAVLKDLKAHPNPPIVIVYTSFAYPQYQKAYIDAGADYFFDKAQNTDALLNVIAELAQGSLA